MFPVNEFVRSLTKKQSFPVIVALETSPIPSISNRATALHAVLQGKHSSLLNTRYTVSARKSFEYQKKITTGELHGMSLPTNTLTVSHTHHFTTRILPAADACGTSSTVVQSRPRETTDTSRFLEVVGASLPRKRFVRVEPGL